MRTLDFRRSENLLHKSLGYGVSTQDFAARLSQVGGPESLPPDFGKRRLNDFRRLLQPETLAQQHGQRQNLASRICGVSPGDIVSAAMIRLENTVTLGVEVAGESDPARRNQYPGDVGENVAEEIGSDDYVESRRVLD